jgi:hypothetical protein
MAGVLLVEVASEHHPTRRGEQVKVEAVNLFVPLRARIDAVVL